MGDTYIDTVHAPTLDECRAIVRERYGRDAYIYRHKLVRSGGFLGLFSKENVVASVIVHGPKLLPPGSAPVSGGAKTAPPVSPAEPSAAAETRGADPNLRAILSEIKTLKDKIDTKLPAPALTAEHESLVKISDALEQNDFSPSFRREIIERLRKELSISDLNDYHEVQQKVLEWICGRVKIYNDGGPRKRPRIIVLVGPTGVGKTTTICKLAASLKFPEKGEQQNISLITIDLYRIAAAKQLGELAGYLKADFTAVNDGDELKSELALRGDSSDAILIDTIGGSPHDSVELAQMKQMLSVCGANAEVYLTIMAATKTSDIIEIMRQFEPFGYRAVIITKLDETKAPGNVLSALAEQAKPLAYVTDGQPSTPKYLQKANIVRLLMNMEGFTLDRDRLEAYLTYSGQPL
jgi:flagellar biosynthesis protein FlhF